MAQLPKALLACALLLPFAPAACSTAKNTPPQAASSHQAAQKLDEVYRRAPDAKAEIDALASSLAAKYDGKAALAPLKGRERAMEKVMQDYGADASRIKDIARNTIVVADKDIDAVLRELEASGASVKRISAATDPLGYSGANAVVDTKAGIMAEIQVASAEMLYAKLPPKDSLAILGKAAFDEISSRTGLPPGQGHIYYERWRALPPGDPRRGELERESRAYYDGIRNAGR